jgi:hypothetical protein
MEHSNADIKSKLQRKDFNGAIQNPQFSRQSKANEANSLRYLEKKNQQKK